MLVETSSDKTSDNGSLQTYGIDFKKEAEDGNMGNLIIVDEQGNETNEIYEENPDNDECVILENVAELLNVSRGDTIHLNYQQYSMDVEVVEICVQDRKFLEYENALIILNLDVAQEFFRREGEINYIYGTLKDPQSIYDASNLDATTNELRRIGTKIQERLDINQYSVSMPKLEELEQGEFLLLGTTVIFWFITFLAMLITGILINSILSTSSEEKIREFGILRVVGGSKTFPFKVVLFEGLLLGIIGSFIGIILGLFFTEPIAQLVISGQEFDFLGEEIEFVILPQTLIIAGVIGSIVPLAVSLFPALKTASVDLIKSITPFQQEGEGWEIKKEGSMNVKLVLIGLSISTIGLIIFVLMPQVFVSGDFMLIAGLFIGLLAAILIGLVFASIGVIPFIQSFFLKLISMAIRKYNQIIKISLKRYRRRNTSTVIMFAISFSFIFFITTYTEMSSDNMALNLRFQYGSDLVLINEGQLDEDNAVNIDLINEIKE
jgi:ABC-type lipoprotein release transport system permease subunit